MSAITTHILDTSLGQPASNIHVLLAHRTDEEQWVRLAEAVTDADGRIGTLLSADQMLVAGIYRLCFQTADYFAAQNRQTLYPQITIEFTIVDTTQHYHIPLLLNPFGYSTYRGS